MRRIAAAMQKLHVVLALACLATAAHAEPATDLYKQAVEHYSMARFREALGLLERAKGATADPKLLGKIQLQVGVTSAVMGRTEQAKTAFEAALSLDPGLTLDPRRFKADVVELLKAVRGTMLGELSVSADKKEVVVLVDGREAGRAPFSGRLPVGRHRVEARTTDGLHHHEEQVVIALGRRTKITARLVRLRGRLTVHSTPEGARVLLDGRDLGTTPLSGVEVDAGRHELTLQLPRAQERRLAVVVPHRQEKVVRVELEVTAERGDAPRRRRIWTWVAAGGAIAALGVGAGLGGAALADHSEYESTDDRQRGDELEASGRSKSIGANVMFGVGGALAVTAVVLYFLEGRPSGQDRRDGAAARVTPLLGPSWGFSVTTRWSLPGAD